MPPRDPSPSVVQPPEHSSSSDRAAWQPLVDDAQAAPIRLVILEIADELAGDPQLLADATLGNGAAGRALFFGYLADAWPNNGFATIAERWLDRAVALMAEQDLGWDLFGGLTGIAWTNAHLLGRFADPAQPDENAEIDDALTDLLRQVSGHEVYDLIRGFVGHGVYALERLPRPSSATLLASVLECLDGEKTIAERGVTWLTRPEHMANPHARQRSPQGHYNLGVAHGVPGVIALLAAARAAGIERNDIEPLYRSALAWTLAQQLPADSPSAFPSWVSASEPLVPARSAWCYGDPGIAATLFAAARVTGDAELACTALALGRRAAAVPPQRTGVRDAMFCHGAVGLAHLYNRLWQGSGDPCFAEAARRWYDKAVAYRRPGRGLAGFQSAAGAFRSLDFDFVDDASLITGIVGLGLALLAAITPVEPAWDRVFLASLPDRR